jgi:hypothetical protein
MIMGYRSDVGLCLNAESKTRLDASLNSMEESSMKNVTAFFGYAERKEDTASSAIAYLWRDYKWYPDYPGVAFLENFLTGIDDDGYLFIRIGESDDDTETGGCFWENPFGMCLVRDIVFDG